jgi:hypothetical protein
MMGGTVEGMVDVNFDLLKTESYNLRNMMRSISSLMLWDGVDINEMSSDLNGVEKQNSLNNSIVLNNNGIDGGKNHNNVKTQTNTKNITKQELEEIKEKWSTILSRAPYVLKRERCETLDCLLDIYRDLDGMFKGAFGISQTTFEKYWKNDRFIDKYEMDFYFKNYAESI